MAMFSWANLEKIQNGAKNENGIERNVAKTIGEVLGKEIEVEIKPKVLKNGWQGFIGYNKNYNIDISIDAKSVFIQNIKTKEELEQILSEILSDIMNATLVAAIKDNFAKFNRIKLNITKRKSWAAFVDYSSNTKIKAEFSAKGLLCYRTIGIARNSSDEYKNAQTIDITIDEIEQKLKDKVTVKIKIRG